MSHYFVTYNQVTQEVQQPDAEKHLYLAVTKFGRYWRFMRGVLKYKSANISFSVYLHTHSLLQVLINREELMSEIFQYRSIKLYILAAH